MDVNSNPHKGFTRHRSLQDYTPSLGTLQLEGRAKVLKTSVVRKMAEQRIRESDVQEVKGRVLQPLLSGSASSQARSSRQLHRHERQLSKEPIVR
jgi:hypothetical protein